MAFAFELSFTGLCVLTLKGRDKRRPEQANILLVKTDAGHNGHGNGGGGRHLHQPRLNVATENLVPLPSPNHQLVGLPSGLTMASRDISGSSLSISVEGGTPNNLDARWMPDGMPRPQVPPGTAEEEWLDWVPNLRAMEPQVPAASDAAPHAGLEPGEFTATVRLDRGILKAALVGIEQSSGDFLLWDFKETAVAPFNNAASQAIASLIVLRLEGLTRRVTISGLPGGESVLLQPARRSLSGQDPDLVRASVTNLPSDDLGETTVLRHFVHFFDVVNFTGPRPPAVLPHARQGRLDSSSSGICPSVRHTGLP